MLMVLLMLLRGSAVLSSISELAVCRGSGKRDAAVARRAPGACAPVPTASYPCKAVTLGLCCTTEAQI